MPIPTYDELLRPLLEVAATQDISRQNATEAMVGRFHLSAEEATQLLPSGQATTIKNRTGWAMTYLTKAGLIEKVVRGTYRITDRGREFLSKYPQQITVSDLETIPGFEDAWDTRARRRLETELSPESPAFDLTSTPNERIETAFAQLREALISDLLTQLGKIDPFRFEQTVLDLLVAMGYGGSRKEAAAVTQRTGDEGIDGVINEDRLGLDVIYVQAKRWKNNVGRPEIQSFVGALAGKKANKGIFITTSSFHDNATEYATGLHQKIILIDGRRLAELMIEHNIGVAEEHAYRIKKIDSDYFEES